MTDTLRGRIVRLTGTDPGAPAAGPSTCGRPIQQLRPAAAFLKINGIAFDGDQTLYTSNYSTGELFAVRIAPGAPPSRPADPA